MINQELSRFTGVRTYLVSLLLGKFLATLKTNFTKISGDIYMSFISFSSGMDPLIPFNISYISPLSPPILLYFALQINPLFLRANIQ